MQIIRAIPAMVIIYAVFFYATKVLGVIHLSDVMTPDEQKKTGITRLSDVQKQELESWLNQKFTLKTGTSQSTDVYLSENIRSGSQLRLSDGSLYEVSPQDRSRAQFWITPFQVKIEPSSDPNYPYKITNTVTGVTVGAKQVTPPK